MPTHTQLRTAASVAGEHADSDERSCLASANDFSPHRQTSAPLTPARSRNVGGSQAHLNMQPFLTINFCIALQGIFPSQN